MRNGTFNSNKTYYGQKKIHIIWSVKFIFNSGIRLGNIWAEVLRDCLIRPYVSHRNIPPSFSSWALPCFLGGALTDGHSIMCDYLNATFPNRWIGRNGAVHWPVCSLDKNPLDFYLCMLSQVYATEIIDEDDLSQRVNCAAQTIRGKAGILQKVRGNWLRRFVCIEASSGYFEIYCQQVKKRYKKFIFFAVYMSLRCDYGISHLAG